jgi:TonB family protein
MKTKFSILAAIGLLPWPGILARAEVEAGADKYQPLRVIQTTETLFPPAPLGNGYRKGHAAILITVDASGKLTDSLAISYTLPYFAEAAKAALREWTYEPARVNGRPVGVTKKLDFNFELRGFAVVSQNISDFADQFLRRFSPDEDAYRAYTVQEIDGKLNATRVVHPPYPKELATSGISGTVTLAYYVDEKGRVRMPVVLNDADPELVNLAVEAVKQWQFEPPTKNGRPVLVSVRQEFQFNTPNRS